MARRALIVGCALVAGLVASGCGSNGVQLSSDDPNHTGAVLFAEHCAGCHTLKVAGTEGSASDVKDRERTDGPNFDTRQEGIPDVLYAIRNGGFSGAIMPENIVTGGQAFAIARFLSKYAGRKAHTLQPIPTP
ncbi:MAG: c-type cytochrome [Actinomycetota bacterium]|nr:c-type cytochrome [Actinomycetota bacterium]